MGSMLELLPKGKCAERLAAAANSVKHSVRQER